MTVITASFRTIHGTEAAEGVSGGGTVVVDRPDGVADGRREAMAALRDEATEGSTIVNAVKRGAPVDVELR